jgi:multimeric flavodoxin WrbA
MVHGDIGRRPNGTRRLGDCPSEDSSYLIGYRVPVGRGGPRKQKAPVARPEELADYDATLFGTTTRFGNMAAQMRNFLDQTGPLWAKGALIGKVGSDGSRKPSATELGLARFQGRHVAEITRKPAG